MQIKCKINKEESDHQNFKYYLNRMIKYIKEHCTNEEQASHTPYELMLMAYQECNMKDLLAFESEMVMIEEIINQIVKNEWKPEDEEEIKEYIEIRKNLVLPILEEGTMEYKIIKAWYDSMIEEDRLNVILYSVMTLCKVFRWNELDYHLLDCQYSG